MALLEKHFRNRFAARDGGYVFRQWGQEVAFTPAEVDGLIAERNRLWSYWTFAIYAAFGIAAPLWLGWKGWQTAAWALAGTALLMLAVILVHGERIPNAVAEGRVPTEPNAGRRVRSPHERALWSVAWIALGSFIAFDSRHHDSALFWIWGALVAIHTWELAQYLRKQLPGWWAKRT